MVTTRNARACRRALIMVCVLMTTACGHLYEGRRQSAQDKVSDYIEGLDIAKDDMRLSSLRAYGQSMANLMDADTAKPGSLHEASVAMERQQACLAQSWGWKAEVHRTALSHALIDSPEAQARYMAYMEEAVDIPPSRGDACNY